MKNPVARAREKHGYTQNEASFLLHIAQPTLSQIEKGFAFPTPGQINSIADLFHIDKEKLIEDLTRFQDKLRNRLLKGVVV
jgi:transcriptional regulator with XRE-family HTH domain